MRRKINILFLILALGFGFEVYQYLVPRDTSFGLFSADDGSATARFGLAFIATILGVVLGSFYRNLKRMKEQGKERIENISVFFGDIFLSVDMWLGLVTSPIVFALILKASDGMALPALIVMALENGFCALIIIDSFMKPK